MKTWAEHFEKRIDGLVLHRLPERNELHIQARGFRNTS